MDNQIDEGVLVKHEKILKSLNDDRLYKGLVLENGLKCLLISDSKTDRSAASVAVNTGDLIWIYLYYVTYWYTFLFKGSMLDPDEFPGLAHFCEHILFMGSEKVR